MAVRRLRHLEDTAALAAQVAQCLPRGQSLWLEGPLGAGKTAFARALLHGLGYAHAVRSPTYSLIESYSTEYGQWHHLDLYRLSDAEELDYLGFADLHNGEDRFLIEWAQRAASILPSPFAILQLDFDGEERMATLSGPILQTFTA